MTTTAVVMRFWVISGVAIVACREAHAEHCARVAAGAHEACTLDHGGREREYRLYIPASVRAPSPVVVNLHGRKGTAKEQEGRLAADADRFGFILVSPQGYERSWNAGVGFGPAHASGLDDVGFVRAVVADLGTASAVAIDSHRVYATGLSNGGRMVHRLACEASDVFAAVASVAGPIADRNTDTGERAFECRPERAVPVMVIHGTQDRCTPYAGGSGIDTRGNVATPDTALEWARRDACTTTTTHGLGSTTCEIHRGCRDGAEVALCTIANGGHVWPGAATYSLWQVCGGRWPDDFRATDQMWGFFAAHPLPGGDLQHEWQPLAGEPPPRDAEPELEIGPVDSVDIPFDRSQLSLTLRGNAPSTFAEAGKYQDGAIGFGGAVSLYSRLHVAQGQLSALRVMAQFRIEGERVRADRLASDQQVTKGALGVTAMYLSPSLNLYALYAGAALAETSATLSSPKLMPAAIGIATYHTRKELIWIYGGGLGYALGRAWVLPAAGVMWSFAERWRLTAILPLVVDLHHSFTHELGADLVVAVSGDRFNFSNQAAFTGATDTLQLRLGQLRTGIAVAYKWNRSWSLRGELGVVGPRRLTIVDGDTTVMSSDSNAAGYLSTTVNYAFGSSPL